MAECHLSHPMDKTRDEGNCERVTDRGEEACGCVRKCRPESRRRSHSRRSCEVTNRNSIQGRCCLASECRPNGPGQRPPSTSENSSGNWDGCAQNSHSSPKQTWLSECGRSAHLDSRHGVSLPRHRRRKHLSAAPASHSRFRIRQRHANDPGNSRRLNQQPPGGVGGGSRKAIPYPDLYAGGSLSHMPIVEGHCNHTSQRGDLVRGKLSF